jgi:3-dehydroquinate synthase
VEERRFQRSVKAAKTFHKPANSIATTADAVQTALLNKLLWDAMAQVTIHVPPRPYQARIENGLLARAGTLLAELLPQASKVFLVTVAPVRRRWGSKLVRSLVSAGFKPQVVQMPDGETAKKLKTIETLAEKLSRLGADRKAVLIALGGGVVGDVTGLLASLYMRGVELVQIPTTVLAQVDASVGGKTGVNLGAGKNLLGTFYHPRTVLIDPEVLRTLPNREFRAGLYEALKCGIIGDLDLFLRFEQKRAQILKRDPVELEGLIAQSVKLKAEVVSADEREGGLRRVLNLGHTIGHALEAETGYRSLLHGEAVAWGLIAATNIALTVGRTDSITAGRIADAVLSLGKLPELKVSARKILARLQADKKTQGGVVHFVLPREIGKVEIAADVPDSVVINAVEELRRLSRRGWGK